jgi:hypothetical protein
MSQRCRKSVLPLRASVPGLGVVVARRRSKIAARDSGAFRWTDESQQKLSKGYRLD